MCLSTSGTNLLQKIMNMINFSQTRHKYAPVGFKLSYLPSFFMEQITQNENQAVDKLYCAKVSV